jgi:hypothetical protein
MSDVAVKESAMPMSERMPRPRVARRLISLSVVAAIIVALLGAWFIYLPWLLRSKVEQALRSGGVRGVKFDVSRATPWGSELSNVAGGEGNPLGIRRVVIDYSPIDLWDGKLDAIHIVGARITLDAKLGKVDVGPLAQLFGRVEQPEETAPSTQPARLPVSRIDLTDSQLVVNTEQQQVTVPLDVTVVSANPGKIVADARLGPNRNMIVGGMIDLAARSATFEGAANAGWTLVTARAIWPDALVGVDGFLQLTGSAQWSDEGAVGLLRVEIGPPASTTQLATSTDKLHLESGVLVVKANFGKEPEVRVSVRDANFKAPDAALTGEGISADVAFSSLSPLATPPDQKVTAKKLSIGQMNLTDGQVTLQMPSTDTINIRETRWNWLGGQIFSQGIRVRSSEPVQMTLQLRDVQLGALLDLLAKEKASGEARLTGTLPVTIDASNVQFGDGRITAVRGGSLQIRDLQAMLPTAEAAARRERDPTASEQIKRNIIEALSDFVFDTFTAQLANENGRLVGYVRINGRGRSGAQQPIDYKLNLNGLDDLLRAYLEVRKTVTHTPSTRKASS